MAFQRIRDAEVLPGKLIRHVLDKLPGKPAVWLERIDASNRTFMNAGIAKIETTKPKGKLVKDAKDAKAPKEAPPEPDVLTYEALMENRAANVAQARETITAHCVRKIEAVHDDGREATDEDIPEFCEALPSDAVLEIHTICLFEKERWRPSIEADPEAVAKK